MRQPKSSLNKSEALVIVREDRDTVEVTGTDRQRWLNGLLTCSLERLGAEQGAWGLLLSRQGKIQSDVDIVPAGDSLLLGVAEGRGPRVHQLLEGYLVMDDVDLYERSTQWAWITLHGPLAAEVASEASGGQAGTSAAIDWTGLGGAALVVARDEVRRTLESLTRIGRGAVRIGTELDWLRLRVERGLPAFGADYDDHDNPHDASLEQRAVSWTKGCYLGQEVVCMQAMRGKVKRRIAPLVLDGEGTPRVGDELREDSGGEEVVGQVTSAAMSEALGRGVALARLSVRHSEPGTLLRSDAYVATVVGLPSE